MTAKIAKLEPRQVFRGVAGSSDGGWSRIVHTDDHRKFRVTVTRGNRVRIAFKPIGPTGFGYKWYGRVWELTQVSMTSPQHHTLSEQHEVSTEIWHGEVGKSIGARGLLTYAGIVEKGKSPKEVISAAYRRKWLTQKHLPKLDTFMYGEPIVEGLEPRFGIATICGGLIEVGEYIALTLDLAAITCHGCREKIQQAMINTVLEAPPWRVAP